MKPTFFRQDDPEHARLRRMLTADFTVKRADSLRPDIQRLADDLVDRMTDGRSEGDLVTGFALPLPSVVICLMLGVPYQDHQFFQERAAALFSLTASADQVRASQQELLAYLAEIAEAKRSEPDDSVISRLAAAGELDVDSIASTGRLLLVAGHETTANMIALSTLALLRNPDQLARLREEPALIKGAVEELLRYVTIVHSGIPRVAIADAIVGGRVIRDGEGVLCMVNTANRDEAVFPGADTLDVGRDARRHVAFGFGVHQCLGQPLARAELEIALGTLLRRLPGAAARRALRGDPLPPRSVDLRARRPAGRLVAGATAPPSLSRPRRTDLTLELESHAACSRRPGQVLRCRKLHAHRPGGLRSEGRGRPRHRARRLPAGRSARRGP